MSLQTGTFRTRALTSLVFVVVMLVGLLWNEWSFFVLFSIIHFGCWYEYQKLLSRIDPAYREISVFQRYGVMIAGWCIMMYCSKEGNGKPDLLLHNVGLYGSIIFLFILPVTEILYVRKPHVHNMGYSALGLIYISLSLGLLLNLRTYYPGLALEPVNKLLVIMIILSLWVNDTMAYLVGSLIGKTPLSKISPKKTWEGTIGGILFSIVFMGVAGYFLSSDFEMQAVSQWVLVAAIASVSGTLGDLLQSKLKRMADVKDSGQIMPGHGGFLDRFDSLLFATPFIWLYITMFA
ncbi:MAG: phosphatidate cytidylyltransferase [Bacteroidota bacterium]|nr:phosphatidate cytidylyltransferase [Bacteroidota bacterium]MDP4212799.1 phosphatidate cytidylyltransferase [Bacteroidota bacterium]MDP4250225.1 phosphatidate cytidylyltransferase [Bacteroidota bacterium]